MPTKNVYLSDELYAQLYYLTLKLNLPISDLLRMCIEEGIKVLKLKEEGCHE